MTTFTALFNLSRETIFVTKTSLNKFEKSKELALIGRLFLNKFKKKSEKLALIGRWCLNKLKKSEKLALSFLQTSQFGRSGLVITFYFASYPLNECNLNWYWKELRPCMKGSFGYRAITLIKNMNLVQRLERPKRALSVCQQFICNQIALVYKVPIVETTSTIAYLLWNKKTMSKKSRYIASEKRRMQNTKIGYHDIIKSLKMWSIIDGISKVYIQIYSRTWIVSRFVCFKLIGLGDILIV